MLGSRNRVDLLSSQLLQRAVNALLFPGMFQRCLDYESVLQGIAGTEVLINEKNRRVEIYLHLKTPSMLMGEVLMDSQLRPGSAAAATLLRWQRHLAIGCDCIGDTVRMASFCGGLFLKLVLTDHSLARRVVRRLSQRCTQGTLFCYAPRPALLSRCRGRSLD
ncbi:hypothetical protein MRX96_039430 [Rhipicephalus microplus]